MKPLNYRFHPETYPRSRRASSTTIKPHATACRHPDSTKKDNDQRSDGELRARARHMMSGDALLVSLVSTSGWLLRLAPPRAPEEPGQVVRDLILHHASFSCEPGQVSSARRCGCGCLRDLILHPRRPASAKNSGHWTVGMAGWWVGGTTAIGPNTTTGANTVMMSLPTGDRLPCHGHGPLCKIGSAARWRRWSTAACSVCRCLRSCSRARKRAPPPPSRDVVRETEAPVDGGLVLARRCALGIPSLTQVQTLLTFCPKPLS